MSEPTVLRAGEAKTITAIVTADVDLVAQTVQIRFNAGDWITAEWGDPSTVDDDGTFTREATAFVTVDDEFETNGYYTGYCDVSDAPSIEIFAFGFFDVRGLT